MHPSTVKSESLIVQLVQLVESTLGIDDKCQKVALFILGLYNNVNNKDTHPDAAFTAFKQKLAESGASGFPQSFSQKCFEIIRSYNKLDQDSLRSTVGEYADYPSLCLPDKQPQNKSNIVQNKTLLPDKTIPVHSGRISSDRPKPRAKQPKLGDVFEGLVANLTSYGAFIKLEDTQPPITGLCHVSKIDFDGKTRVEKPSDVLQFNQRVFVKVEDISPSFSDSTPRRGVKTKVSLTMRGIDQKTGKDESYELYEQSRRGRPENTTNSQDTGRYKRRLTSPERWEISQLIASGAASEKDFPEISYLNEDPNALFVTQGPDVDNEVEVHIELNKSEPLFLEGQVRNLIDHDPVQVFKNPEGSLSRTALNGSSLAREFKENKFREKKHDGSNTTQRTKMNTIEAHDPLQAQVVEKQVQDAHDMATRFAAKLKESHNQKSSEHLKTSILTQRKSLPVYHMRKEIVDAVRNNQWLVVVGETGSGKTTQIVQYLMEEGLHVAPDGTEKMIGCTQPRRVAAVSVAKRVSEEVGCQVGDVVGYSVRFDDSTSRNTRIKYMTDGMLQREILNDSLVSRYSIIMLDEAHERTIATDVLFALLKSAAAENPNLKVIVTSATLDSQKFSAYFDNCPVMTIPGRTYPVEVLYTQKPEMDYVAAALDSVMQIHMSEPAGDILVFLTGQEEIDTCCEVLQDRMKIVGDSSSSDLVVLPIYAALPPEMQGRIFEPAPKGSRKVILATNIAETSITIDGIFYVVDPGFVKINAYDSRLGMDTLMTLPISKAQANQRSGRAGRTGPGKCYRLYTKEAYEKEMMPNTVPEIQRQNLSHTILMLKAMGINNMLQFNFMDPPPPGTMLKALHDLYTLAALDSEGYLTALGRQMADFPMEPALAKTLLASTDLRCLDEVLSIVAMLSVQTVFYRPKDRQRDADQRRRRLTHPLGDHLTLLNVYRQWQHSNYSKQWCQNNYIQERSMRRAQEVRRQLLTIMQRSRSNIESCGENLDTVRKAFTAGYFKHLAKRDPSDQGEYITVDQETPVFLHPSSSLVGKRPEYVIYHTLLLTTKEYMHCATTIEPQWLAELAPNYFKIADHNSQMKKKKKIVPLLDRGAKDKNEWRLSAQNNAKKRTLGNK